MFRQSIVSFLIALGVSLLIILFIFPQSQGVSAPPVTMLTVFIVVYLLAFLVISRKNVKKKGPGPDRPKAGASEQGATTPETEKPEQSDT